MVELHVLRGTVLLYRIGSNLEMINTVQWDFVINLHDFEISSWSILCRKDAELKFSVPLGKS